MMSQVTHGELHFSVEGAFIMDLAREAYWFEGRKEWALDVLSCFRGITTEQTMKVLRGEAILKGLNEVQYFEVPDTKFQKRLADHEKWIADEVERKRKEVEEQILSREKEWELIERIHQKTKLMAAASELHDEMMEGRPEKPKELVAPKVPVKLGKFSVEKQLLDNYVKVASDHDLQDPWNAGTALLLSGRMMRIHLILRESVGLEGYWGRDEKRPGKPDAFDEALQTYVHKAIKKDDRYIELQKRMRRGSGAAFASTELAEASHPTEEEAAAQIQAAQVYERLHPADISGKPIEPIVTGLPGSPGTATGPVKLALKKSDMKDVKKGDVLVTSFISPDTIFAIEKVAAIVTDVGGLTSHAAIVSREFQVPCIVGALNATKVLKDGQVVTVDGTTGKVFPEVSA